jgi:hypothetical protein
MPTHHRKQYAKRMLDELLGRFANPLWHSRESYWRLIHAVRASSTLLAPSPKRGHTDPRQAERVVRAGSRLAQKSDAWRRPPETWIAPCANAFTQFRSLVCHLLHEYPVPRFMTTVWLCDDDKPWELDMYLHLAQGKSIRQFELPPPYSIRISKSAARFFMLAPDDVSPLGAYRWAHVRSLGGDATLARLLMTMAPLCTPTEHEAFWESVIRFLIVNMPICRSEIIAIVEFVYQQRFVSADTVWGPGAGEQPLQPNFTLRGRSLRSLRRHMANWREELSANLPPLVLATSRWERTPIRPFRHVRDGAIWTIDELLSDRELRVEGGIMQHCVADYSHDCARRRTTIWSMKVQRDSRRERELTIEVRPQTKTIYEALGKRNSPPTAVTQELLDRWAHQEGLNFA